MAPLPLGSSGTETLLVVENEAAVRNFLQTALRRNGYTVLTADSGRAALELLRIHDGAIDLLISDVVMPDMDGPELVRHIVRERPGTPALLMSGYPDEALGQMAALPGDVNFIQKPFSPATIVERVRGILDSTSGV